MTANFPTQFISELQNNIKEAETTKLLEALEGEPELSIRFNPYKLSSKPEGDNVPWCRYGYYLSQRPQFTLDPMFHGGEYYVQEASSMFIEHLFRSSFEADHHLRILDLCAAPGGKTTLLSTLAGAESLVVANEVIRSRAITLADNVRKWGIGNVVVTNNDPSHFAPFEHYFDMILVDAPCSGEGMFRKNREARDEWSEANVKLCAARSRRILSEIWGSLKPGGVIVYSTCTFNHTENEDTIKWLCEEYDCEPIEIEVNKMWGIEKGEVDGVNTFRFYPHKVRGEGFFAAILRKGDGRLKEKSPKARKEIFNELSRNDVKNISTWVNQPDYMLFSKVGENIFAYYKTPFWAVRQLSESLTVIYSGVIVGQLFGTKLRPEHPLALFNDLSISTIPSTNLELAEALNYLRKNDIDSQLFEEGINLVCFNNLPIGWIKRIGNRVNNMYPKELRIATL